MRSSVLRDVVKDIAESCLNMAIDIIATSDPVRFPEVALETLLKPGFVVDMLAGWDLEDKDHVEELDIVVKEIGSPPCEAFSPLMHTPERQRKNEELRGSRPTSLGINVSI